MWFPSVQLILYIFQKRISPMSNPLINVKGLIGTLDKVKYGIPFHPEPSIWERTAILYQEIIENHYFVDGNKRIGSLLAFVLMANNSYRFNPPKGDIFSVTMDVAQGKKDFLEIVNWFKDNSKRL